MHDVPKRAILKAVRGPRQPGKQTKKYSRLLADEDESDDDDDYAPPDFDNAV